MTTTRKSSETGQIGWSDHHFIPSQKVCHQIQPPPTVCKMKWQEDNSESSVCIRQVWEAATHHTEHVNYTRLTTSSTKLRVLVGGHHSRKAFHKDEFFHQIYLYSLSTTSYHSYPKVTNLHIEDLFLWYPDEHVTRATYVTQLALDKIPAWVNKWCVSQQRDDSHSLLSLRTKVQAGNLMLRDTPLKYEDQQTPRGWPLTRGWHGSRILPVLKARTEKNKDRVSPYHLHHNSAFLSRTNTVVQASKHSNIPC